MVNFDKNSTFSIYNYNSGCRWIFLSVWHSAYCFILLRLVLFIFVMVTWILIHLKFCILVFMCICLSLQSALLTMLLNFGIVPSTKQKGLVNQLLLNNSCKLAIQSINLNWAGLDNPSGGFIIYYTRTPGSDSRSSEKYSIPEPVLNLCPVFHSWLLTSQVILLRNCSPVYIRMTALLINYFFFNLSL